MKRSSLAVATAIFALVIAIALPISKFFRPAGHSLRTVLESHWVLTHIVGAIAYGATIFFVLAVAMLFAKQLGTLGIAAALIGAVGAMLCFGDQYYAFFMQSVYAENYPESWSIFDGNGPLFQGGNALVIPLRDLTYVVGAGAVGIGLMLYTSVARWASALFALGLFGAVYGVHASSGVSLAGTAVEAVGLLGIAFSLLQQRHTFDGEATDASSWLEVPADPASFLAE